MRRFFLVAVVALALPMLAFANSTSTDFVVYPASGTLGGLSGGGSIFDTGSTITLALGYGALPVLQGANLGTLSFSTGSLVSSFTSGANIVNTFASGGSFTITGSGSGLPGGVLFSGTFQGKTTLITVDLANGSSYNTLSCETANGCSIVGQWANGAHATGSMVVIEEGGTIQFAYVNLQSPLVPEPGTLGLLGTGLLGLGAIGRRKLKV